MKQLKKVSRGFQEKKNDVSSNYISFYFKIWMVGLGLLFEPHSFHAGIEYKFEDVFIILYDLCDVEILKELHAQ